MNTRRGFLAALGLGAGASMLGLPGMAHALGGRWRRARGCCSECGAVGTECGCQSPAPHSNRVPYGTGTPGCACACPQTKYTQANGIYYYHCLCCPGGTPINASSGYDYGSSPQIPCPPPTPTPPCIGACASPGSGWRIYSGYSALDECGFYLDPTARDKNLKLHANAFKNGIAGENYKDSLTLNKEIKDNALATTNISGPVFVYYDTPRRDVALYDLACTKAPKGCELYIGFQISDTPDGSVPPDEWGIPFAGGLPYYHHVYFNTHRYHVVTKK
jgi:hypothetical protein